MDSTTTVLAQLLLDHLHAHGKGPEQLRLAEQLDLMLSQKQNTSQSANSAA
jgi:hypothetical protein